MSATRKKARGLTKRVWMYETLEGRIEAWRYHPDTPPKREEAWRARGFTLVDLTITEVLSPRRKAGSKSR